MCEKLNKGMLKSISQPKLNILVKGQINCPHYLKKRTSEFLTKYDSSMTAGLNQKLVVKLQDRVMLWRNIDVSLGLDNGSINTIEQVIWDIDDHSVIHKLRIKFSHG